MFSVKRIQAAAKTIRSKRKLAPVDSLEFAPITWRGRDLSTDAAILYYHGGIYVRPVGRGVVLKELELEPHLDEVLDDGDYEIEIRIIRRLPAAKQ
jgi:hypothetical protein